MDGKIVFSASARQKPSTLWRTDDPFAEHYEKISEPFDFWNPHTFHDDDGRVYFYWGCDAGRDIYSIEMDPKTLMPIGEKKELIFDCRNKYGWERCAYPSAPAKKYGLGMEILYFMMKLSGHGGKDSIFIEGDADCRKTLFCIKQDRGFLHSRGKERKLWQKHSWSEHSSSSTWQAFSDSW